jgi:hypothetical protein
VEVVVIPESAGRYPPKIKVQTAGPIDADWKYLPPDIEAAVRELHTLYAGELFRWSRWEAIQKVTAHLVNLHKPTQQPEIKDETHE